MTVSCDTCSKPGACCHDFVLNGRGGGLRFDADNWKIDAENRMEQYEMPFIPLRIDPQVFDNETGNGFVAVRFTCPKVTPEGRCGIYDTRPQLCRDYEAGSDKLCVMYVEPITEDQL